MLADENLCRPPMHIQAQLGVAFFLKILIYNKRKEATVITCASSATPHSLSREEFKKTQESYYTIDNS